MTNWSTQTSMVAAVADIAVAIACLAVILAICGIVRRRPDLAQPYRLTARLVAGFILTIGGSSLASGLLLFGSYPQLFALVNVLAALSGVVLLYLLWRASPNVKNLPSHAEVRQANIRLITEAEAHVRTLNELRRTRDELERRVAERTSDLAEAQRRYEMALRGSNVVLFIQDDDLRYLWINNPVLGRTAEQFVGLSDDEVLPAESRSRIVHVKRIALETGEAQQAELSTNGPEGLQWWLLNVKPEDVPGQGRRLYCCAVDITERKENEQRLRFFMRELTHRSKNLLAVIQAMARQTARNAETTEDFIDRFSSRLQALSASHDLLVLESASGVRIDSLLRSQLGHTADLIGSQILIDGPPTTLNSDATQHIGLALHELATNAAKYGALSSEHGKVHVSWRVDSEAQTFQMEWREQDGPAVTPPSRRGFGQVVIERMVARTLEGEVDLSYKPTGVVWRLTAPLGNVISERED
jgi:two-component sensor histidine kinase